MFEIKNYEPKPVILIRPATVQELTIYEKWKQESSQQHKS